MKKNIRRCPLCGKPLRRPINKDHIIPRALIKWSKPYVNKRQLSFIRRHIENKDNVFLVHEGCNTNKQSCILTFDEIQRLHFTPEERSKFSDNYRKLRPYIRAFEKRVNALAQKQHGKCFYCKKPLNPHAYAIRRISFKYDRVFETNGCLACYKCSAKRF